jgi:AmmeMemoRadiSam system protein B/AmmeMemoRadiSam system protein A
VLALLIVSASSAPQVTEIREPAVAGSFYPSDSTRLGRLVQSQLQAAGEATMIDGEIVALIVPHAGLVYSGPIAAFGYQLLTNRRVKTAVLCGPSHRYGFRGISVYGPGIAWKTPLGRVRCHDPLCERVLANHAGANVIPQAHRQEHSLEVQLPFLQSVLDDFRIVPIVMGRQDAATIDLMTRALDEIPADSETILIAATDWQHYHPASTGWKMDSLGIACLEQLDPNRLEHYLTTGRVEACGGGPTVAVLRAAMARGANRVKILKYGDSGDITGDKSSVVSYVAAVIYRSHDHEGPTPRSKSNLAPDDVNTDTPYQLSDDEKRRLLQIARESIEVYLSEQRVPGFEAGGLLQANGAAFVTLTKNHNLRGCIGYTQAFQPLHQTVAECAVKAAVADRRFPPVTAQELPGLEIEVSVLTPLTPVAALEEIEVGRDGLVIRMAGRSGLLLPQVATEYGWNRTQFLEQTCRKAGLPLQAYRSPEAEILRFQALVFGEAQFL